MLDELHTPLEQAAPVEQLWRNRTTVAVVAIALPVFLGLHRAAVPAIDVLHHAVELAPHREVLGWCHPHILLGGAVDELRQARCRRAGVLCARVPTGLTLDDPPQGGHAGAAPGDIVGRRPGTRLSLGRPAGDAFLGPLPGVRHKVRHLGDICLDPLDRGINGLRACTLGQLTELAEPGELVAQLVLQLGERTQQQVEHPRRVTLSARATRPHRPTPARVNVQVVEVMRHPPQGAQLGELRVKLRHQTIKDRLLSGVLTTRSSVRIERLPTVVKRAVSVLSNGLAPRLELGDAHAVSLKPPGRVGQRAALGETGGNPHRPAVAERRDAPVLGLGRHRSQLVDRPVTTEVANILGREHMLVAAQSSRDRVTGLSARAPNLAARAEALGQAQVLDVLRAWELVSDVIEPVNDAFVDDLVDDEPNRLLGGFLEAVPRLRDRIDAALELGCNLVLDEVAQCLEHRLDDVVPDRLDRAADAVPHRLDDVVVQPLEDRP